MAPQDDKSVQLDLAGIGHSLVNIQAAGLSRPERCNHPIVPPIQGQGHREPLGNVRRVSKYFRDGSGCAT